MTEVPRVSLPEIRQRAFEILEHGRRRDVASRILDAILVVLIVANVAGVVAQTVPEVAAAYGAELLAFDRLCVAVFALEYAARIWVAPEHPMFERDGPLKARLRFAGTPMMVIDGIALVPFLLEVLFPASTLMPLTRDFAFIVPDDVAAGDLVRAIAGADKALIQDVRVFDRFEGDAGLSLAVEVTIQPTEKTLTDEDIGALSTKVVAAAEKLGASLRS